MKSIADQRGSILGVDIGSAFISMVRTDFSANILQHHYAPHKGQIHETLLQMQQNFDLRDLQGLAFTSTLNLKLECQHVYDPQTSIISGGRYLVKKLGSILNVGAEKSMLIEFDRAGNYKNTRRNSSCAAGTGSFLDQQARRLDLEDAGALSGMASAHRGDIPSIATRCAVFAKTDLIHRQQEGWSLPSICKGLCKGLAKNLADTLFGRDPFNTPILFTGGVSRNAAVVKHLEDVLHTKFMTHEHAHLVACLGACLQYLKAHPNPVTRERIRLPAEVLHHTAFHKNYYYEPLRPTHSEPVIERSNGSYAFSTLSTGHTDKIQVELYKDLGNTSDLEAYLGMDIGSTSTKAILTDIQGEPLAGFYTYTAGKPVNAAKAIFESIVDLARRKKVGIQISAAGTTGSGRKLIGKIMGADLVIDEISAHARAAYELNPETDTIIEIGGQDAKFTLLRDGMVTFSQMNTVCAAGTGSFIEEQAEKLNCPLSDLSRRTAAVKAPLASDRCTVFMERDLNHYMNDGFSTDELLASALHSVRENYLKKVAIEGAIGKNICFQGATARNRSLVAAFEQKLHQKIFVSKYCHLTGALGVALLLKEDQPSCTAFRGLDLYKDNIPLDTEICDLCTNHCRITVASIRDEQVACGFLCGRDYNTHKYVKRHTSGFDLLKSWNKIFNVPSIPKKKEDIVIGLPAALHLFDELCLWKRFFSNLSITTVSSEKYLEPVEQGKCMAGAEFCAPINAMYGHTAFLADNVDYIFLPIMLEARSDKNGNKKSFCYYTQYSSGLAASVKDHRIEEKCLLPLIYHSKSAAETKKQLWQCLNPILEGKVQKVKLYKAFDEAEQYYLKQKQKLIQLFEREFDADSNISVMLTGRPYVVLSPSMNKGIPNIFSKMGIKTFFQEMVPAAATDFSDIDSLLTRVPWQYAVNILKAAKIAAVTEGLFPVLITAFKCAPDSFIIDYFKKILDAHHKPYLILQIDEHQSNTGFETRIEAAIRTFKNHASRNQAQAKKLSFEDIFPVRTIQNRKTLLFPNWDPISSPLVVANLQRSGIDARLLKSDPMIIKRAMAHNTGQCLPLNIIVQEFIEYIQNHNLQPENTMLWMMESLLSCNLRQYPYFIKSLLNDYGKGMEKASVYSGKITHLDISLKTCYHAYFAHLFGGLLRKLGCKFRPYEIEKGTTDQAIAQGLGILEKAFLGKKDMEQAIGEVLSIFDDISITESKKPKVAIFGDLFVRDNDVMNQDLIHAIEDAGGEAITTSYVEYVKITSSSAIRRRMELDMYLEVATFKALLSGLDVLEKIYYKPFKKYLGERPVIDPQKLEKNLSKFNITKVHSGESYDNILKLFYLIENHSDIALFVQTNPAYCCPSLITEAMTQNIRAMTGIPIITLTYDGTHEYINDAIIPYLQFAQKEQWVG